MKIIDIIEAHILQFPQKKQNSWGLSKNQQEKLLNKSIPALEKILNELDWFFNENLSKIDPVDQKIVWAIADRYKEYGSISVADIAALKHVYKKYLGKKIQKEARVPGLDYKSEYKGKKNPVLDR